MTGPIPGPKARRRWRLALTIRGLMLLVVAVGLPLGWKARRASVQRRAVAAVERLGGTVIYDWDRPMPNPGSMGLRGPDGPAAPRWARRMLGDAYFQEVVEVWLNVLQAPQHGPLTAEQRPAYEREARRTKGDTEADQLA